MLDLKNLDMKALAEHVMKNAKDAYRGRVGPPPDQKAILFIQHNGEPSALEFAMQFADDLQKAILLNEIVDRAINLRASALVLAAHVFVVESTCASDEIEANRRVMRRALELKTNLQEAVAVSVFIPGAKPYFIIQEITRVDDSIQFFIEPKEYGDFAFYEEAIFKPYLDSPTPLVV